MGLGLESVFSDKDDYFVLEAVQFGSPLKLLGLIPKLPCDAKKAILKFFKRVIFYDEEKSSRRADAALKWEEVHAKRIQNAKEILTMLPLTPHHSPDDTIIALNRLMKQFDQLRKHPAELTHFDVTDED